RRTANPWPPRTSATADRGGEVAPKSRPAPPGLQRNGHLLQESMRAEYARRAFRVNEGGWRGADLCTRLRRWPSSPRPSSPSLPRAAGSRGRGLSDEKTRRVAVLAPSLPAGGGEAGREGVGGVRASAARPASRSRKRSDRLCPP